MAGCVRALHFEVPLNGIVEGLADHCANHHFGICDRFHACCPLTVPILCSSRKIFALMGAYTNAAEITFILTSRHRFSTPCAVVITLSGARFSMRVDPGCRGASYYESVKLGSFVVDFALLSSGKRWIHLT